MARKTGFLSPRKAIYVFWEGESEEVYTKYLKKIFSNKATIFIHGEKGTFHTAKSYFRGNKRFQNNVKELDEIWFFFDVETKDIAEWENRMKIVKRLRSLRKKPNIKVRLLMTTGCIEYWLMLHYEMFVPSIQTVEEKRRIMAKLLTKVPDYEKGNLNATFKIAQNYPTAVRNAKKTVSNLLQDGLPGLEDTDERNRWLCQKCLTFSTVYEAIDFLTALK